MILEKVRINKAKLSSDIQAAAASGLFKYTVYFLLAVAMASGRVFTTLSPFAAALIPAVPIQFAAVTATGAAIGYFINFAKDIMTLRYAAACVISLIGAAAGKSIFGRKHARVYAPVSSFVAVFSTGIVVSAATKIQWSDILVYTAEGAAAAASAYFIYIVLNLNREKRCFSRLNATETAAVLIFFCEGLIALNSVKIFSMSVSGVCAAFAVLCAAAYGREKGGSLAGICAGVTLSVADSMSFLSGGFALGGLLAGIFGRKNRFVTTVIFILTVSIMAIPTAPWTDALGIIYDVTLGGVLFIAMPRVLAQKVESCFSVCSGVDFLAGQKTALKMRLTSAADAMNNVSSCVRSVLKIFERRNEPGVRNYSDIVKTGICISCPQYTHCWNEGRESVRKMIKETASGVKSGVCESDCSACAGFCENYHDIYSKIYAEYNKFCGEFSALSDSAATGNIVADQFATVSDFFSDMASRIESREFFDAERSMLLNDVFSNDLKLSVLSSGVFIINGRLCCEIYLSLPESFDSFEILRKKTSALLGTEMESPVTDRLSNGETSVRMCEKTVYTVNYGGYQFTSDGESLCGDTYDCFNDGRGNFIMMISDGMGTGKRAAVDSVMTGAITSSLMRSGFNRDSILNIVNSSMMIRAREESISTLDICSIDLYTGRCVFYKAGASFSYVTKKKKLIKIEKPSMPIGILRNVTFEKAAVTISDGDKVILMSDGVGDNSAQPFREILFSPDSGDGEITAKQLAKAALAGSGGKRHDDITVVTAILTENI